MMTERFRASKYADEYRYCVVDVVEDDVLSVRQVVTLLNKQDHEIKVLKNEVGECKAYRKKMYEIFEEK